MRCGRLRFACAVVSLIALTLFLACGLCPEAGGCLAKSPAPASSLDETVRMSDFVPLLQSVRDGKALSPVRQTVRGGMPVIVSRALCALFCAIRAYRVHAPRGRCVHSLRAQIGHPHQAPPLFQ